MLLQIKICFFVALQYVLQVAEALVRCGYNYNTKIVLAVCANLEKLLGKKELSWSNSFLTTVMELCILHMNSNDAEVRHSYTSFFANIPWDVVMAHIGLFYGKRRRKQRLSDISRYSNDAVNVAQHIHISGVVYEEMQPLQFKVLMKYLLDNEEQSSNWLEEIFICCWPLESDNQVCSFPHSYFRLHVLS